MEWQFDPKLLNSYQGVIAPLILPINKAQARRGQQRFSQKCKPSLGEIVLITPSLLRAEIKSPNRLQEVVDLLGVLQFPRSRIGGAAFSAHLPVEPMEEVFPPVHNMVNF